MQKIFTTLLFLVGLSAPWALKAQVGLTLTFSFSQDPELLADAGADTSVCDTVLTGIMLNGSGSGGDGSYTYLWAPPADLSSATIANPVATPSVTTTYTLMVMDGNNCTASDDMVLTVDSCLVGMSEIEGLASVTLYPNPNKGAFKINASLEKAVESFKVTVVTVNGQEIFTSTKLNPSSVFTQDVNLVGISRGVYFVRMDFDGTVLERKIIVQ
jgi:hypothetical protein